MPEVQVVTEYNSVLLFLLPLPKQSSSDPTENIPTVVESKKVKIFASLAGQK